MACWHKHRVVEAWYVDDQVAGKKLPEALAILNPSTFPTLSRSRKACRQGKILLNGSTGRCIHIVARGDTISLQERNVANYDRNTRLHFPHKLEVVYEDDDMACVVKPEGIPTTSSGGNNGLYVPNVKAALPYFLKEPSPTLERAVLRIPLNVHRLDAATSGLLCVAKTRPALLKLQSAFALRQVAKVYTAVVLGRPARPHGLIDSSICMKIKGDKLMRPATTEYRTLEEVTITAGDGHPHHLSLLELKPKTGRTHQLRIHTSRDLGCPIIGDRIYDKHGLARMISQNRGLFLCANALQFTHPIEGKPLSFSIEAPSKFSQIMMKDGQQQNFDLRQAKQYDPSLQHWDDDDFIFPEDEDDSE